MVIYDWMECPVDTPGKKIWMKSTPSSRGPATRHPSLAGKVEPGLEFFSLRDTPDEISPRRYSIIEQNDEGTFARLGSVAYGTGFDSFNVPLEVFAKYIQGEFQILMEAELSFDWDGSAQQLYNNLD